MLKAREELRLAHLTKEELKAYYDHLDNVVILRDNIYTEREERRMVCKSETAREITLKMKQAGIDIDAIETCSGLDRDEIMRL